MTEVQTDGLQFYTNGISAMSCTNIKKKHLKTGISGVNKAGFRD